MKKTYEILCASEALGPITHMSGTQGNEAILSRKAVATPVGTQYIPCLSGNAIRHRTVREPGMRWLVDAYGLAGKLTLTQFNFLFHGGSLTLSTNVEDLARVADWQRLFPLGRLLGGSLPDQILSGSLQVSIGLLACRENEPSLRKIVPEGCLPDRPLRSASSFVDGWQYTRSGSASRWPELLAKGESTQGDLMIYAGESVMRGAIWIHGYTALHVSELELGALLWSLELWQSQGGAVGGSSGKGHGRLATSVLAGDFDGEQAVESYKAYALSVRDEAVKWLDDVFRKTAEKTAAKQAAKGKPGKGKK